MKNLMKLTILTSVLLNSLGADAGSKKSDQDYAPAIKRNEAKQSKLRTCKKNCKYGAELVFEPSTVFLNMNEFDVEDVEFNSSQLRSFRWNSAELKRVVFKGMEFRFSSFEKSTLSDVTFANIRGESYLVLDKTSIQNAKFSDVSVERIMFSDASISQLEFKNVKASDGFHFNNAVIANSKFDDMHFRGDLDLSDAKISRSSFKRAIFDDVWTVDTIFLESDFQDSTFKSSVHLNVFGSKFNNAVFEEGSKSYIQCTESDFSGAVFRKKGLRLSRSINCNFSNADLSNVEFTKVKSLFQNNKFCNAKMPDGSLGPCQG